MQLPLSDRIYLVYREVAVLEKCLSIIHGIINHQSRNKSISKQGSSTIPLRPFVKEKTEKFEFQNCCETYLLSFWNQLHNSFISYLFYPIK